MMLCPQGSEAVEGLGNLLPGQIKYSQGEHLGSGHHPWVGREQQGPEVGEIWTLIALGIVAGSWPWATG